MGPTRIHHTSVTLCLPLSENDASSAPRLSDAASLGERPRAAGIPNNIAVVVRVRPEPDARRCGFTGPHPRGGIGVEPAGDGGRTFVWMAPADAGGADGNGSALPGARNAVGGPVAPAPARKRFYPEEAFGPGATQEEVYATAVRRLVGAVASGVNASVLGYGATGSGKTVRGGPASAHTRRGPLARPDD